MSKPRSNKEVYGLENTGRILYGVTPTARRILFGETADTSIEVELGHISQVDLAHIVMLAECGIIDRDTARQLIREINDLRASNFEPLRGQHAPRGLYLLYENYLIGKLGECIGGALHTARSRNDLNATTLRLRLRTHYLDLLRETLRLQAVLIRRGRRFADVVMPSYTHYQAAVPITYGHYLAGIGCALGRDIAALAVTGSDLNRCPLGAGAIGGVSLPIDPARTASLLGFSAPVLNSVDSIASRDFILRLLSAASILGVTLSRLSADLLLWTTKEFGLISLPDNLVGSSSMMPQKRNPFLLEHVQGRSAVATGAFMNSVAAMHAKPFTNSIAVGIEAVTPVWNAMKGITEAVVLTRLVVADALPRPEAMLAAADEGYTSATELANRLVVDRKMAFRTAHKTVGSIIRTTLEKGGESLVAAARWREAEHLDVSLTNLDPASVVQATVYGGGPGRSSVMTCLQALHSAWSGQMRNRREQEHKWRAAEASLHNAVQQV